MLAATASFINCTGGFNGDTPTEITRTDVDEVVRTLLNNNAYTIMDNIEGEDKFGTAPVRDAYFALCSTQLTGDLDSVSGFIQKTNIHLLWKHCVLNGVQLETLDSYILYWFCIYCSI